MAQNIDQIDRGESVPAYETERLHRDGRRIAVSVGVSPVVDATGRVVGAATISRDITQQKALARLQEDFLAMVTHDLTTPLTVLMARAQTLQRRAVFDERAIAEIVTQSESAPSTSGVESGGNRHVTSPGTPSGSRLVANTVTDSFATRSARTSVAHSSRRCSQLSNTSSDGPSPNAVATCTSMATPERSPTRSAPNTALPTSPPTATGANSTFHAPPRNDCGARAATDNAKRVLPTPPAPVTVTSRAGPGARRQRRSRRADR